MQSLDQQDRSDLPDNQSHTATVLLSTGEAAAALRIGRSKLYELIANGDVETVHIGRSCRVPIEAVHSFVDRLRNRRSERPR